ncbi:hypothetical protein [Cylindrospermum sp. FACHB-282]|uniref:hypothetical protein n=1 Tax=Cylindrospermum sp. FACHB-282 TaxID=2692794 RepID=UPI001684D638|nr:hypothetical protein [Cylindrospermum sp. FACHB-282]MBD2386922.1 hypothetical protein [Cylindrospermum sp. FACHB-282]
MVQVTKVQSPTSPPEATASRIRSLTQVQTYQPPIINMGKTPNLAQRANRRKKRGLKPPSATANLSPFILVQSNLTTKRKAANS